MDRVVQGFSINGPLQREVASSPVIAFGQHIVDHFIRMMGNTPSNIVIGIPMSDVEDFSHRVSDMPVVSKILRKRNRIWIDLSKLGANTIKARRCGTTTQ